MISLTQLLFAHARIQEAKGFNCFSLNFKKSLLKKRDMAYTQTFMIDLHVLHVVFENESLQHHFHKHSIMFMTSGVSRISFRGFFLFFVFLKGRFIDI